jgi:protein TonB
VSLAAVDHVLARRARRAGRRPETVSLAAAVLLHVAAIALLLLLPRLAPPPPQLAFVPVQIIPAQALGVRRPASRPKAAKPAPPEPEPAAPEPEKPAEPETKPPEAAPVLPSEKPEKPKPEPRRPAERSTGAEAAGTAGPQANPGDEAGRRGAPDASPLGTSAFGSKIAGLDNPDFRFGYYIDQLLQAIDSKWNRPTLGSDVRAVISFRIERNGDLTDLEVAESSGYGSFDLAALRGVQNAAPFPPLPRAYRHDSLGVNLIVE